MAPKKKKKGANPLKAAIADGSHAASLAAEKESAAAKMRQDCTGRGKKFVRQHGGVVTSRGEVTHGGVTMKEWQRTPKQLINEYCQKEKRPKPR